MAAQVKNWKEASTLILATKKSMQQLNQKVPGAANKISSTLSKLEMVNSCDYNIITMKRSKSSKFFPNAVVFPGGMADKCDFSPKWFSVFEKRGISSKWFDSLKVQHRPPMYRENAYVVTDRTDSFLPAEVGYRINAIRETFEETGALIARSDAINDEVPNANFAENIPVSELMNWRRRISNDAAQFINLCLEYKLYPDVFSLREWCNWLTPVTGQGFNQYKLKKRYDTMFYIACVEKEPVCSNDGHEAQYVVVSTTFHSFN